MAADESQKQKWGDCRSKEWGKKGSFRVIDGSLSSQEFGAGTSISEIQRQSRTPRWHCKICFRVVCSIYWPRIVSISNDSRKCHGHFFQDYQDAQHKQQTKYPVIRRSKWRTHQRYWRFQSQNVQKFGYVYQNTNGPKSWSSMEGPVVALERNLYGHPLAGLLWERQFEKVLLKYGWEKVSNWECLFVHREKGYSYLCMWMTSNWLERNQNIDPMWKVLDKKVDLGEPTSFLDHVNLGCTQRQCEISKDIVDNYRTMFESRISAGLGKSSYFFVVLR